MIKKALEYIVGLGEAKQTTIHGDVYSDKELHRVGKVIPYAKEIELSTLSSLVQYIKSNVDTMAEKMIVHVENPTTVKLFSSLDELRKRECLVEVNAQTPSFSYERFLEHEAFCIGVQAKFLDDPTTDRAAVLAFAGTVEAGSVAEYGDDGVTQKATVKTGIASKNECVVPNPVLLRPFRTFVEVEQPASHFVFRMKQDRIGGIECALFEADGGAWKNIATKKIHEYLEFELAEIADRFIVIS